VTPQLGVEGGLLFFYRLMAILLAPGFGGCMLRFRRFFIVLNLHRELPSSASRKKNALHEEIERCGFCCLSLPPSPGLNAKFDEAGLLRV